MLQIVIEGILAPRAGASFVEATERLFLFPVPASFPGNHFATGESAATTSIPTSMSSGSGSIVYFVNAYC